MTKTPSLSDRDLVAALKHRFARDDRAVQRLMRQLGASEAVGAVGRYGKHIRQTLVRVEFWSYNSDTGQTYRAAKPLRAWGWTPRQVKLLLLRAMERDRVEKLKALKGKRSHHVSGVSDGGEFGGAGAGLSGGVMGAEDGGRVEGEPLDTDRRE